MRKIGISSGVGLLVALLSVATLMASPAAAARHHRHHRRHHHVPVPVPVPVPTVPVAGCATVPHDTQIQGVGTTFPGEVIVNIVCTNLPPNIQFTATSPSLANLCAGTATPPGILSSGFADNSGNAFIVLEAGPAVTGFACVPGSFVVNVSENTAPKATFFVTGRLFT